jgi:hypothetical protein
MFVWLRVQGFESLVNENFAKENDINLNEETEDDTVLN